MTLELAALFACVVIVTAWVFAVLPDPE